MMLAIVFALFLVQVVAWLMLPASAPEVKVEHVATEGMEPVAA